MLMLFAAVLGREYYSECQRLLFLAFTITYSPPRDGPENSGLGRKLSQYGIENFSVNELAVNEQNPLAKGFYEHMGFQVYKRTDHDEQGNPYPLLYMKLN